MALASDDRFLTRVLMENEPQINLGGLLASDDSLYWTETHPSRGTRLSSYPLAERTVFPFGPELPDSIDVGAQIVVASLNPEVGVGVKVVPGAPTARLFSWGFYGFELPLSFPVPSGLIHTGLRLEQTAKTATVSIGVEERSLQSIGLRGELVLVSSEQSSTAVRVVDLTTGSSRDVWSIDGTATHIQSTSDSRFLAGLISSTSDRHVVVIDTMTGGTTALSGLCSDTDRIVGLHWADTNNLIVAIQPETKSTSQTVILRSCALEDNAIDDLGYCVVGDLIGRPATSSELMTSDGGLLYVGLRSSDGDSIATLTIGGAKEQEIQQSRVPWITQITALVARGGTLFGTGAGPWHGGSLWRFAREPQRSSAPTWTAFDLLGFSPLPEDKRIPPCQSVYDPSSAKRHTIRFSSTQKETETDEVHISSQEILGTNQSLRGIINTLVGEGSDVVVNTAVTG